MMNIGKPAEKNEEYGKFSHVASEQYLRCSRPTVSSRIAVITVIVVWYPLCPADAYLT